MEVAAANLAEHLRAAREVLPAWNIDVADVQRVSVSENIAFRVVGRVTGVTGTDDRSYVLRLHRPGYHSLDELIAEQAWTQALLEAGIDVPVPVRTRDDHGYSSVKVNGERRHAGILQWVDGEPLHAIIDRPQSWPEDPENKGTGAAEPIFRYFERLGEIMAAMHNQAVDWQVPTGFTRHAFDADGLMGETPFWGRFWESPYLKPAEQRRLEALRQPIREILDQCAKEGLYSLIHADLHPGNVIVNGSRLHVIDFDDSGFGWHHYDFAVALYHYQHDPRFEGLRDALFAGYRRVRRLGREAAELLPLFLLIRSLALIGWCAARPELAPRQRSEWLMQLVERSADGTLAKFRAGRIR